MTANTFKVNVEWNLEQITALVGLAGNVNGRARSGYYKVAIILAASIVEALAYRILEQNSTMTMPFEDWECKRSSFLPKDYKSIAGNRLSICERIQPQFKLTKLTDFRKVNDICLKLGIFSPKLYKRVEKIRNLRNKIHIQGLNNIDRSYTKRQLEVVSSVINDLLSVVSF